MPAAAAAEAVEALRDEGWRRHLQEKRFRFDGRVSLLISMVGFDLALTAGVLARLLYIQ